LRSEAEQPAKRTLAAARNGGHSILPPNPRWGMSEQGSKMTGMDAAPHEHRDVRTQGLQGCAGIAIFPEGC
jgi:hypothetical protein